MKEERNKDTAGHELNSEERRKEYHNSFQPQQKSSGGLSAHVKAESHSGYTNIQFLKEDSSCLSHRNVG